MRLAIILSQTKLQIALAALALLLAFPSQSQEAEWAKLSEELVTLYRQGNYGPATKIAGKVVEAAEKAFGPEHPNVAKSLNRLAVLYELQSRFAQAESTYKRALGITERALGPEHPDVADIVNNLAILYQSQGRYALVEPLYKRSLAVRQKALGPEHPAVAMSMNNLAELYREQGRFALAEPLYKRFLAMTEKALGAEHPDVAIGQSNLAIVYRTQGRYAEAEDLYKRSLVIREKTLGADHPDVSESLNNLAELYQIQGQYARAAPLYARSQAIAEKAVGRDHQMVARVINNIALLHKSQRQFAQAELLMKRSLAMRERSLGRSHPDVAESLNNLAGIYGDQGRYSEAEPLLMRSLAIRERALGPDHVSVAWELIGLAELYRLKGRHEKGEPLLLRALQIVDAAAVPPDQVAVYKSLATHYVAIGQSDLAILFGKQAVNILQALRGINAGLDQGTKRSSLKKNESTYAMLADLLIAQGRLPEAQQIMAMLKEEEYFEFVHRSGKDGEGDSRIEFSSLEAAWQAALQGASRPLSNLGREKAELERMRKGGLTPDEEKRLGALEGELRLARQRFDDAMRQVVIDARRQAGNQAMRTGAEAIESLRAWRGTLKELGEGTVLLTYVVAPERLWIILTTPEVQVARKSNIGSAELNKLVFAFRRGLSSPRHPDVRPDAQALYQHLIAPVVDELEAAKARTLMVSLDGSLRYVPMGALHDGKRYLVERFRTAMFTEAAKSQVSRRPSPHWSIAGMGLTRAVAGFDALPGVKDELDGLVRVGDGTHGVLPGEIYLDERFTSSQLQAVLGAQVRPVLHIASHFHFSPGADAESFLVLGDGAKLTLREVRDADLRFDHVDLLTLSACETGIGDNAQGREVEGLGALAQKQGAKAVVATLWPVADTSTGLFMRRLYQLRDERGLSKAESIRQVQLEFLEPGSPYQHPLYWAPFILMGNWL